MQKLHDGETCIEMTGTQDRVTRDGDIIRMSHWIAPSREIATIAHEWFEGLEEYKNIEFTKPGDSYTCYAHYKIGWFKTDENSSRIQCQYPNFGIRNAENS